MTEHAPRAERAVSPTPAKTGPGPIKFNRSVEFQVELKRRVDAYFEQPGNRRRDCPQIYVKAAVTLSLLAATYVALVFFPTAWWLAVPLAAFLGLLMASVGLNIQHDGGHGAFSSRNWVNTIAAYTLDLVGGSSYLWRWKHGVFHHTYTNITGHDTDIDLGVLGRLSPHQPRYWYHRFQHIYVWFLYCFMAIKWHFVDDFKELARGKIGNQPFPRPKGWDAFGYVAGKVVFFTLAFVIPIWVNGVWPVLACYGIAAAVTGIVLSVVFQLAHCVEEAEFPMPYGDPLRMASAWAVHQAETTADFGRENRVLCWLVGGLNFQVEHHLLPKICHINFPALSKIVEQTCADFGVRFTAHKSFAAGIGSHYRHIKLLGKPEHEGIPVPRAAEESSASGMLGLRTPDIGSAM